MMSELFGKPIAACPAGCGCLWRDNRDGTMSLFGENSSSCEVCEYATWNELIPLKIDRYSDTLFLSQRLQRVASMVDLKYLEMSDTQVCEVAGTILGEIARKLSELVRERDRLRQKILGHNQTCLNSCEMDCSEDRSGTCVDCPQSWMIRT